MLYSDGITECADANGDLLDEDGFAEILTRLDRTRGLRLVKGMADALHAYNGGPEFYDDLSAVVIERI